MSNIIRLPLPCHHKKTLNQELLVEVPVWMLVALKDRVRDLDEILTAVQKITEFREDLP